MKREGGFTLLELILSITIIGVLSGTAAVKFFSAEDSSQDSEDAFIARMREFQIYSMLVGSEAKIKSSTTVAHGYESYDPGGNLMNTWTFGDGAITPFECSFDRIGVPNCVGGNTIVHSLSSVTRTFTVMPVTGRVEVQVTTN